MGKADRSALMSFPKAFVTQGHLAIRDAQSAWDEERSHEAFCLVGLAVFLFDAALAWLDSDILKQVECLETGEMLQVAERPTS